LETRKLLTSNGLNALEEEFNKEDQQILLVQAKVDQLRRDLKISDQAQATEPTPSLDLDAMQALHRQMIERQGIYTESQTQLEKLKGTDKIKLRDVLPSVVNDGTLADLQNRLHEAQQKIATLKIDYAVDSVTVRRVQSLIDELNGEIDERVAGIMAGLESKVSSNKAALDAITQSVEEAKAKDMTEAEKNQPYYEMKRKLVQMQDLHKLLYSKVQATKLDLQMPVTSIVQITDPAEPGKSPVKPNKPVNIALGLIFGLIMGVGLAFFIEYLDTSVKTIDDVERTFQCPVLGVIPQNIGYLLEDGAESKHAEAYRVLRTNLLFSRKSEGANTIVLVSAGAGEGKSTTTINLATVFAQSGSRVLVVDSDLRRPTLHKLFKVANNLGLTNYLLKQNTLAEIIQTSKVPNLDFMASGRLPNSAMGILGSAQMKEMIKELHERYDFIFFDSPPILGVSDASILASEVDLVMQVVQYRRYPQPMTIRAKQMIEKVGGNLVGIVLNNINMSQDEGYYYYSGYYHDYYYSRSDSEQEADAKLAQGSEESVPTNIKPKY
jgi:capsular exopolysaccharide synthesis family protein